MRWLINQHGYCWIMFLQDCLTCTRGSQACYDHGLIQHVAPNLKPNHKRWLFWGWALHLIKIFPPSLNNIASLLWPRTTLRLDRGQFNNKCGLIDRPIYYIRNYKLVCHPERSPKRSIYGHHIKAFTWKACHTSDKWYPHFG